MDAKRVGCAQTTPLANLLGFFEANGGEFSLGGVPSARIFLWGKCFWKFEGNIPGEKPFVGELSGKYSPLSNSAI